MRDISRLGRHQKMYSLDNNGPPNMVRDFILLHRADRCHFDLFPRLAIYLHYILYLELHISNTERNSSFCVIKCKNYVNMVIYE